jgi:hypothetical protein
LGLVELWFNHWKMQQVSSSTDQFLGGKKRSAICEECRMMKEKEFDVLLAGVGPVTLVERPELLQEAEHDSVGQGFHLLLHVLPC